MTDELDSCYEPDAEDFAYMIAREGEVASLRSKYHDADRELRNYQKHTDRQLRGYCKEKKLAELHLVKSHQFYIESDSYEVEIGDDVYVSTGGPFDDEAAQPATRKDKRRAKTGQRRAARFLRNRRAQWEKSRAASMVRKTGALSPMVAGVCHA